MRPLRVPDFFAGARPADFAHPDREGEIALRELLAFYKAALDETAIVAVTDAQGTILSVNSKFCEISGYAQDDLIGANHRLLRSGVHDPAFYRDLWQTISRGQTWRGEICNRSKGGMLYWVDTTIVPQKSADGKVESFTAIRFDITQQKRAEEELRRLAHDDALTGLPNRRRFMEMLEEAIAAPDAMLAVGLLDVDHFKDINDSLGHDAGDALLAGIAQRIRAALDPQDVIARLGGDEFALILRGCPDRAEKEARIARIYAAMKPPLRLGSEVRDLSVSLGLVGHNAVGSALAETGASGLLKAADTALYAAKANGRNCAEIFDDTMRDEVHRRMELARSFDRGIAHGELCVHYQPIVPIFRTKAPIKLEALLRWQHPDRGLLGPADFHDVFANEALVARADAQVLETVLADIRRWKAQGVVLGSVAVNATLADFRSPRYVERILAAIRDGEIAPGDLCIEINEGMLIGNRGSSSFQIIETLHNHGVEIAFDDFGTGYASLRQLRELPHDFIKIDQSFVRELGDRQEKREDRQIVEGITRLAHDLGKKVIAEGVETPAQWDILDKLGCDYIQGFLVSHPVPASELTRRLRSNRLLDATRRLTGKILPNGSLGFG